MKTTRSNIQSISPFASLVVIVFFLAISGLAIGVSRHASRTARLVASVKPTPIAAAADSSVVAWVGNVKAIHGQMLVAPATHTPCCWFRVTVTEASYDADRETNNWTTISQHESTEPFLIQDSTGEAAVYPSRASITPTDHSIWYGNTPIPQDRNPPRLKPGESPPIFHLKSNDAYYGYTEERIYCGDPLYALGPFKSKSDGQPAENQTKDDLAPAQPEEEDLRLASPQDQISAVTSGQWIGRSRFRELDRMVRGITRNRLIASDYTQPYLLSGAPREAVIEANRSSGRAALIFAAFPLGLALSFLWLRFGWGRV